MTDRSDVTRHGSTFGWLDVAISMNRMICDSSEVVINRCASFAAGQMEAEEAHRMFTEKPFAFALAAQRGTVAAMCGGSPSWVAETTLDAIGTTASSNAERLRGLS